MIQKKFSTFVFEEYQFNKTKGTLHLRYSLDETVSFEEVFTFKFPFVKNLSPKALDNAFFGLFIMTGISYYKAYIPKNIVIKKRGLTKSQAAFFQKAYQNGLAQFFYSNHIDPHYKIVFPVDTSARSNAIRVAGLTDTIVPNGGGKDSLSTIEILKSAGENFETMTVGDYAGFKPMIKEIGKTHLVIERAISPTIIQENKKGALNGHVPISAILSFMSVAVTLLRGKKYIAFSNDSSTDEPNTVFKGIKINHQYSKTYEFEKDFQKYVHDFISPSVEYFSFLRPLSQLHITKIFSQNFVDRYIGKSSSCNRNFLQKNKSKKLFWCGECAKCAFVFTISAPFLSEQKLQKVFGKPNFFVDKQIQKHVRDMVGNGKEKPYDCVGEIAEVQTAVMMSYEQHHFPQLKKYHFKKQTAKYLRFGRHVMPKRFEQILTRFLKTHE
jgi:hypothetical protein